jgi:hypothetical protein
MSPALWARAVVVVGLVGLAAFGVVFHGRQRRGAPGGPISRAKVVWLCLAMFLWMILAPVVAFDDASPAGLRAVLAPFAIAMWLRAVAETYLLYVTKSWRPPMGIAHHALCILLLAGGAALHADALASSTDAVPAPRLVVAALLASLVVEIAYAFAFFRAVHGKTTGADGVWFADQEQARFRAINAWTARGNAVLIVATAAFLARWFGGGDG